MDVLNLGGYFRDLSGNVNKIGGMYYSDGKGDVTKIYNDSLPVGTIMYKPSIPLYLAYGEKAFASDSTVSVDEIKTDNIIQLEQPLSRVKNGITINFSNKFLTYYNLGVTTLLLLNIFMITSTPKHLQ